MSNNSDDDSRTIVESPADTVNPDYTEENEGEYPSFEAVTRQRNADGELLPKDVHVEEFEQLGIDPPYALCKPMSAEQRRRYVEDPADPDIDKEEVSDAELAELFDRNLKQPNLSQHPASEGRITERFVREEMSEPMQDACFTAILIASDEHEFVRRMRRLQRGELTEAEMKVVLEQDKQDDGMKPAGDRSRNQARRDRRRRQ